jgi:hypothetical protein
MAGRALGDNKIEVVVTIPKERSRRYIRPFVGMTVAKAVDRLNGDDGDGSGGLPEDLWVSTPYYLNGEDVSNDIFRVIKHGEILKVTDP